MAIKYNIKQITNYELQNSQSVTYTITVPHRKDTPNDNGTYDIEFIEEEILYKTAIEGTEIVKLGYCCEPKGFIYPIFLQMNGKYQEIKIGKNGMYEMQIENWKTEDDEEEKSDVIVTGVRVPANINFTLDYVITIN